MVAASAIVKNTRTATYAYGFAEYDLDWRIPSILFHCTVAVLVMLLALTPVRPTIFYVGIALLYTLTFFQAVTADSGERVVLYQMVVAYLLVVFSVTLNYALFVGRMDLTTHIAHTNHVLETGSTAGLSPTYEPFPLWHVFVAESTLLSGGWLETHTSMYLLSGFIFSAGILGMYALGSRVLSSKRYALFSAFVMICFPLYIFYGMYSIARSVTSVLFLLLLLTLLIRRSDSQRVIVLLLIAAIVIYHPVSIPFVLVLLAGVALAERFLDTQVPIVDTFVLGVAIGFTTIYWFYRAEFIVGRLTASIVAMFAGPSPSTSPESVELSPWVEVANYVPYSFLVLLLLLGFLFWYQQPTLSRSTFSSLALFSILIVPLVFPGPTLLLDSLVGVNVGRFGHYSFMFVALTGGYGLYELLRRGGIRTFLVILVLVSCLSFSAVSNDFVASDNPIVERPFYTFYFTEHERSALEQVGSTFEEPMAADHSGCRYLRSFEGTDCELVIVDDEEELFGEYDTVLLRHHENEKRPLQFSRYVYEDEISGANLDLRNKPYDSGAVAVYTR
ncbi:hypothetical protein ACLI4U_15045 [Natrialbaceae archaeon A-CW2]